MSIKSPHKPPINGRRLDPAKNYPNSELSSATLFKYITRNGQSGLTQEEEGTSSRIQHMIHNVLKLSNNPIWILLKYMIDGLKQ